MPSGGKREGASLKVSASPYGEPTSLIRVPNSVMPKLVTYLDDFKKNRTSPQASSNPQVKPLSKLMLPADDPILIELPIYIGKVSAGRTTGFASPAESYEQEKLDINKKLVKNQAATVLMWVGKDDDSMIDEGIMPGALLVVDKSITPRSGRNVISIIDDEYVVKKLYSYMGVVELRSMNKVKNYPSITFREGQELVIEGVVTNAINGF